MTHEYTKVGGISRFGFVEPFEDEDDVEDPWTSSISGNVFSADRKSQRTYLTIDWDTPIGDLTILPSSTRYQEHNRQQDALQVDSSGNAITGGGPGGGGTTIGWRSQVRHHR